MIVASMVGHLLLEAHRLLRPRGHLVVSSHSATMDKMLDYFGIRESSKLSLLECFTALPHFSIVHSVMNFFGDGGRTHTQVCVLKANMI